MLSGFVDDSDGLMAVNHARKMDDFPIVKLTQGTVKCDDLRRWILNPLSPRMNRSEAQIGTKGQILAAVAFECMGGVYSLY